MNIRASVILMLLLKAGLAYLMNPLKIYDTHFHSMGLRVIAASGRVELTQELTLVVDNKPTGWNFASLFGRQREFQACPLADSSTVVLHNIKDAQSLLLPPTEFNSTHNIATYKFYNSEIHDLAFTLEHSEETSMRTIITAHKITCKQCTLQYWQPVGI